MILPESTTYFAPTAPVTDKAVVILPGGAYSHLADHEGAGYAQFLAAHGYHAFVVAYAIAPHRFPEPLIDARRAIAFVRKNAASYGIDPHKIAVMGSSAGGHLAALTATSTATMGGDDTVDYLPDAQILCYPVICAPSSGVAHEGSYENLLGEKDLVREAAVDPSLLVTDTTPPAFIWHTHDDDCVNVINSYVYAQALRRHNVSAELHVFPHGPHGLGLAEDRPHVAQWSNLLLRWLAECF